MFQSYFYLYSLLGIQGSPGLLVHVIIMAGKIFQIKIAPQVITTRPMTMTQGQIQVQITDLMAVEIIISLLLLFRNQ